MSVAPGATSSIASGIAVAVVKMDTALGVKLHANKAIPSVSDAVVDQNKKPELVLVEDLTRENPRPMKRAKSQVAITSASASGLRMNLVVYWSILNSRTRQRRIQCEHTKAGR